MTNNLKEAVEMLRSGMVKMSSIGYDDVAYGMLQVIAAIEDLEPEMSDLTYSAALRKLRSEKPDSVVPFMKRFKELFDEAVDGNVESPENAALMQISKEFEL